MTLEDALDQALRAMVLLVRPLIELVRALSTSFALTSRCASLASCLTTCSLAVFGLSLTSGTCERAIFLLFNLCTHICYLDFVFAEIDTIECLQRWNPNLELRAEHVVFRLLTGKHWIHWVLDQVEMLQVWVLKEVSTALKALILKSVYRDLHN